MNSIKIIAVSVTSTLAILGLVWAIYPVLDSLTHFYF